MSADDQDPIAVKQFAQQQYRTPANLNARKALHEGFSTNPRGWLRWYMDQLDFPENARVLELGCGTADFWRANLERLPSGCQVALTDFSPGMAGAARKNTALRPEAFTYAILDAQAIPFPNDSFDAVLANHVIYHIPDKAQGIGEMRRVLRPGGKLFAATNGERHMLQLDSLVARLAPDLMAQVVPVSPSIASTFTLENGPEQLKAAFDNVEMRHYPDSLVINQAQPLVDYVLSMIRYQNRAISKGIVEHFLFAVDREIQEYGAIQIEKDAGLLIAS